MSLASSWFAFFFGLVLAARRLCPGFSAEKWLLLAASIVFYLTWSVPDILAILFIALLDFEMGRRLGATSQPARRRRLLIVSLAGNLGLLGFCKYGGFFLENARAVVQAAGGRVPPIHFGAAFPPGISYFTFASMSYVLDVYYERMAPTKSARDYTLFLTFFPKMLSGPIVRAIDLLPQWEKPKAPNWKQIESGLAQMLVGAIKKLVLADRVAVDVNQIFAAPNQFDGVTLWEGAIGFTVQLYCDFSGYSDLAIGAARVLGFEFPENFQMPFRSQSITEFWRRWHITMSTWFRDYLFLPLELATRNFGSPLGRMSVNMTLTMLLCGLWHGPSWNYVLWGGIHGAALSIHRIWTAHKPRWRYNSDASRFFGAAFACGLTLFFLVVVNIMFRTPSLGEAVTFYSRALTMASGMRLHPPFIAPAVAAVVLAHLVIPKDRNLVKEFPQMAMGFRITAYAALLTALMSLAAASSTPFLYFKY